MDNPIIQTNVLEASQQWKDALALRFKTLGGNLQKIVKRQAGFLSRTLIDLSAPQDREKSAKRIEDRVNSKFHEISDKDAERSQIARNTASGDVTWTGASSFALYGIARDVDYRSASVAALEALYLGRGGGRMDKHAGRAKFPRGHGQQDVYIWQRITTKKSTVKQLAKKLIDHLGRLKAAFMVSWEACGSPGRRVPQWISKHRVGARGDVLLDINIPGAPSVTIINSAKGVTKMVKNGIVDAALRIRAKALVADVRFAISNPKEWSEREARADAAEESA